jgi:hypothetical protein
MAPLPPFLKISRIMGLAGNSRQDPDVKELRYQALEIGIYREEPDRFAG